ncbi:hypothetical protein [Paenibacillus chitinolyticus]
MNLDRFEVGRPDPQEAEVLEYCANPNCGGEIYEGQSVVRYGSDLCCDMKCFANAIGAVTIVAGEN